MYGTFLETLITKEHNGTEFSILDSPYRDHEAKEGLKKRFKGIIKETRNLDGVFSYKEVCMAHFWKP